jgi:hypothetical protein
MEVEIAEVVDIIIMDAVVIVEEEGAAVINNFTL